MNKITLLVPVIHPKNGKGYLIKERTSDSPANRSLFIEVAKEIEGSLVYLDMSHCTVKMLYGNKR